MSTQKQYFCDVQQGATVTAKSRYALLETGKARKNHPVAFFVKRYILIHMKYFNDDNVRAVAEIFLSIPAGETIPPAVRGQMGGVKRRARNAAIIAFCDGLNFKDISLISMKKVMHDLFGVAVANEDLMAWATPGRKADDRVDLAQLLKDISLNNKKEAEQVLRDLDGEWVLVKKQAAELAAKARKTARTQTLEMP